MHIGVEQGWWPSPLPECAAPSFGGGSIAERLARMPLRPAKPCDDPTYLIPVLPVSMAAMNLLYALALAAFLAISAGRPKRSTIRMHNERRRSPTSPVTRRRTKPSSASSGSITPASMARRASTRANSPCSAGATRATCCATCGDQEKVHLDTFSALIAKRRVRPTALLPLWHLAGFALGAVTAAMGERAAMACTVAVEEAIDEHYAAQAASLGEDEAELRGTIEKFRAEELEHRDIGLENEAELAPAYRLMSSVIKVGCKVDRDRGRASRVGRDRGDPLEPPPAPARRSR